MKDRNNRVYGVVEVPIYNTQQLIKLGTLLQEWHFEFKKHVKLKPLPVDEHILSQLPPEESDD